MKSLRDDLVKEAAGELGLDLLLDPPVRRKVGDVSLVGGACAARGESDDATISGEYDRPRITRIGELAMFLIVGHDSDLDGRSLDVVFVIGTREGVDTVHATDGSLRSQTMLNDKQAPIAVRFKVLRVADLSVLDDAVRLEETILGVAVVSSIRDVGEH